ncbi:uncharacterized protein LOC134225989 [Armigeres subalbatus]|uniref:uncharacterized protein LOC134225989 n=1 Tax=Armigeres subalbatus TaxID=124917 RepID=UPI002ED19BAC
MDGDSDSDYSDEEQCLSEASDGVHKGENSSFSLPRNYSADDLYPSEKDPRCDPDWQLSTFWPVFVGNFRVEVWKQEAWLTQVSNYFAYRGLLTRMIFFPRNEPGLFANYQKNCLLTDMLVYFTSKEDSERAIATCHQDSYYGFKLNVLPGRTPLYYDNSRSILFTKVGSELPQEYNIVRVLSKFGSIDFAARFPEEDVLVEFGTTDGMLCALQGQMKWTPRRMNKETMKQRFVEATVMNEIELAMRSNATFMDMRPDESVLQRLFEGKCPIVDTPWMNHKRYLKSSFTKGCRKWHPKQRRRRRQAGGSGLPKNQLQKMNIQITNQILKRYGISPISKDSVREIQKKAQKEHLAKFRLQNKIRAQDRKRLKVEAKMNANNKQAKGSKKPKGNKRWQQTGGQKQNNNQKPGSQKNKSKMQLQQSKKIDIKVEQPCDDFDRSGDAMGQPNYSHDDRKDGYKNQLALNFQQTNFRTDQRSDHQEDRKLDFPREYIKMERPTLNLARGNTFGLQNQQLTSERNKNRRSMEHNDDQVFGSQRKYVKMEHPTADRFTGLDRSSQGNQTTSFRNLDTRFEQPKSDNFDVRGSNFRNDNSMQRASGGNRTFGFSNNNITMDRTKSDPFENQRANAHQNAERSRSYQHEDQSLNFLRDSAGMERSRFDNFSRSMPSGNQTSGFGGYGSGADVGFGDRNDRFRTDHRGNNTQMERMRSNHGDNARMENPRFGQYDNRSSQSRRDDHTFNSRMEFSRPDNNTNRFSGSWRNNDGIDQFKAARDGDRKFVSRKDYYRTNPF